MIDWQRVAELRDEVGEEDFDDVVSLFLEEVEETFQRMLAAQDATNVERDLHFLKGCALNMGFTAFTTACEAAETMLAEAATNPVDPRTILGCYQSSKRIFLAELPKAIAS